jgi:PAT family beta-lactamase induction signal transducer AmpG
MISSRSIRFTTFALLYFAQGTILGYFTALNALYLRSFNLSMSQIGLFAGIAMIPLILKIFLGVLSDKVNLLGFGHRKPYILIGLLLQAGGQMVFPFINPAESFGWLILVAFLSLTGMALYDTSTDGLALDTTAPEDMSLVQGIMVAGRASGIVIISATVGVLSHLTNWTAVFAVLAIMTLLPLPLVLFVREPARLPDQKFDWGAFRIFSKKHIIALGLLGLFSFMISGGANQLVNPFLKENFNISYMSAGFFTAVWGIGVILGGITGGRLIKYTGNKRAVQVALFVSLAAVLLISGISGLDLAWPFLFLFGISYGYYETVYFATSMAMTSARIAASMYAILMAVSNVGSGIGLALGGTLSDAVGFRYTFVFFALLNLVVLAILPSVFSSKAKDTGAKLMKNVRGNYTDPGYLKGIVLVLVILAVAGAALIRLHPPDSLPDTAGQQLFSAGRAMDHLQTIASAPHPVGSKAHTQVRDYLTTQLKALGCNPEIQTTTSFSNHKAAVIRNIIAVRKGLDNSKAVTLAAHYDARALAPGASDDGYSVAAILETIRALNTRPPLRNDLIVLLSDGEEHGMLGAKAFVEESSLADSIGIVLNFDTRGSTGTSIMFETNRDNGWVMREFNKAVTNPVATSLSYNVYKLMPNYTDLTFYHQKALAGLNFANIGTIESYHSVRDDIAHSDLRTIQAHGNNMLESVLHFGNLDLSKVRASDVVFFPFLMHSLIIYPESITVPLAVIATLLLILCTWIAILKRQVSFKGLIAGFGISVGKILAAAILVQLIWRILRVFHPEFGYYEFHFIYQSDWYLAAFVSFSLAIMFVFQRNFGNRLGIYNLSIGALIPWLILSWLSTLLLPGGSYLFVWPLIFTSVAFIFLFTRKEIRLLPWTNILIFGMCLIPGIYFFVHVIDLLYLSMTLLIAGLLAGMLILLSGIIQLPLSIISKRGSVLIASVFIFIGVIFISVALIRHNPTERSPKPNTMFYLYDTDSGNARWATWDKEPDEWTSQFVTIQPDTVAFPQFILFDHFNPFDNKYLLAKEAPVVTSAPPEVNVLSDEMQDTERIVQFEIRSSPGSDMVFLAPEDPSLIGKVLLNGKWVGEGFQDVAGIWPLVWVGSGADPFIMTLALNQSDTLRMRIVSLEDGLPSALTPGMKPRPDWMIPMPGYQDASLVTKIFSFPESIPDF